MMRNSMLLLALCCCAVTACNEPPPPREFAPEGPIASKTMYGEDGRKEKTVHYRRDGQISEEVHFDRYGDIENRISYTYTEDGKLHTTTDSAEVTRMEIVYDEQGRRTELVTETFSGPYLTVSTYLNDGAVRIDTNRLDGYVHIHHYDSAGNDTLYYQLNDLGDTVLTYINTYDDKGRIVKNRVYELKRLARHWKRDFGDRDSIVLETWIDHKGVPRMRYEMEYNAYGMLTRKVRYTMLDVGDREDFRYEYEYEGNRRTRTTIIPGAEEKAAIVEEYTFYGAGDPQKTQ